LWCQPVGRRAHGESGGHLALVAPGLAAAIVGADGQVGDEADGHARFTGALLGAGPAGAPPATAGRGAIALGRMLLGKGAHFQRLRVLSCRPHRRQSQASP
jgi:hypothetical protein